MNIFFACHRSLDTSALVPSRRRNSVKSLNNDHRSRHLGCRSQRDLFQCYVLSFRDCLFVRGGEGGAHAGRRALLLYLSVNLTGCITPYNVFPISQKHALFCLRRGFYQILEWDNKPKHLLEATRMKRVFSTFSLFSLFLTFFVCKPSFQLRPPPPRKLPFEFRTHLSSSPTASRCYVGFLFLHPSRIPCSLFLASDG